MTTPPPDDRPAPDGVPPQATVYLVDDDLSHLRSIARLMRVSGYQVVIHNSAAEFLAELRPDMHGCVITDLMMPEMDGMALQQALRESGNPLPIVFLTGHGDIPRSVKAMRGGAEDFLTKNTPKKDLLAAVNRALAHNTRDRAQRARQQALRRPIESLTGRQREILGHVVQGKLNKQIASELGIHERTVKFHRTHITTKLGVHSVAELTRLVQDADVIL